MFYIFHTVASSFLLAAAIHPQLGLNYLIHIRLEGTPVPSSHVQSGWWETIPDTDPNPPSYPSFTLPGQLPISITHNPQEE